MADNGSQPGLIGVDWGTSSFRAYLIGNDGEVLERRQADRGILRISAGGFEAALGEELAKWTSRHGVLPVLMSGMIGSRQGWREAAYARCPAGSRELARDLLWIETGSLGRVAIVPGIATEINGVPDVMRGEETQIVGALARGSSGSGRFVLPGTHSKWVEVCNGAITGFATYMTGEIYGALKDHTILGRLMTGDGGAAFAEGVRNGAREGRTGSLLNRVFSARTLGLFGRIDGPDIAGYLSGVLIGAEIADAAPGGGAITIVGSDSLVARYEMAARHLGLEPARAAADCVAAGHLAIARAGGLIGDRG